MRVSSEKRIFISETLLNMCWSNYFSFQRKLTVASVDEMKISCQQNMDEMKIAFQGRQRVWLK
jgi:hypothetical protein